MPVKKKTTATVKKKTTTKKKRLSGAPLKTNAKKTERKKPLAALHAKIKAFRNASEEEILPDALDDELPPSERVIAKRKKTKMLYVAGVALFMTVIMGMFVIFGYSVKDVFFSPVIVGFVLCMLLIPFRHYTWGTALLALVIALTLLWLVVTAKAVLMPVFIAIFLGFLVHPLVKWLQRFKWMHRTVAVLIVVVPAALILLGAIVLIGVSVYNEAIQFIESFDSERFFAMLHSWESSIIEFLNRFGIDSADDLFARVHTSLENQISSLMSPDGALMQFLANGLVGIGKGISFGKNVVTFFLYAWLVIPLTTYMLLDYDKFKSYVMDFIPPRNRRKVNATLNKASKILSRYVRGMLLLSTTLFVVFFVGLVIARVEYAFVLALLRGVLNMIPYVGVFVATVIAIPVGMFTDPGGPWAGLLKIAIVYGVGLIIDNGIATPLIIGDQVDLHPFVIIFVTLFAGFFFGFVGMLIAVPAAAVISLFIDMIRKEYARSHFYTKE